VRCSSLASSSHARARQGPETAGEDVGAIRARQARTIERIATRSRKCEGADGRRNPAYAGFFFEPTVLVDVNHDMAIMRDETFGPCLPIQVVKDEEEAVRLANDSSYGLQASVWTRDSWKGKRLANRIAAGGVVVDDCMITYAIAESPFGGVKESGIGRVNGELGLKSYCNVQSVVLPRLRGKSELLWYPYTAKTLGLVRRALRLLYRSPLGKLLGN
jgi:succinate-semialdehyde dehydrogenase/glutarate-semialdehyde dehydrogenase